MKIIISILLVMTLATGGTAQVVVPPANLPEQQLENLTSSDENKETEDDAYLQQQQQYLQHPLNLNEATESELKMINACNPLQLNEFISYRNLLGPFISLYELQAIPLWTIELIQNMLPYITVSVVQNTKEIIFKRFMNGQHTVLLRASQVLEKATGYRLNASTATNYYPGSPQKYFFRYQYSYKRLLQYGLLAEKDAGEQFFKGQQKQGFDFYSFHLFVRNIGLVKALAIGDFVVNMGQGLIQWQSMAFKKSADVLNIKREAPVLLPYHSAGESDFHRGLGITLQKNRWNASFFISYKKIDANRITDTLSNTTDYVSSYQNSGYHRTSAEAADKSILQQLAWGANIAYQYRHLRLGLNAIMYRYSLPLVKADEPYNRYSLQGKAFANYSVDYAYTRRNFHLFGEMAMDRSRDIASINGLLISVSPTVDLSCLFRYISRSYQGLYNSAFTESSAVNNETGLYAGITIRPNANWRIDAYADIFQFPWLKYRVDMPSAGSDFLVQATYKPGKWIEIYTRYRVANKGINVNPAAVTLSPVLLQPQQNWRIQINYRLHPSFTIRNRIEMLWFDKKGGQPEDGFLAYFDLLYKPVLKPYSASVRVQFFETNGYNSRLYAFENDILYSFSIPVFYDKGFRYYINFSYDINKKMSVWGRWAQTLYSDKNLIGSGLDEIQGAKKTAASLQFLYRF